MSNISKITDFVFKNNIELDPYGNCKFQAKVEYISNIKNVVEYSTVKIIRNGYEDGKIRIDEIGDLTDDKFHLDFSPHFQKYNFDENTKELVISGSSEKMNGKYTIKIAAE